MCNPVFMGALWVRRWVLLRSNELLLGKDES